MNFKDAAYIATGTFPPDEMDDKEFWEHRERMKEKWGVDQEEEESEEDE